ncbi:unnamed protein product [Bubo scandiacus]
MRDVASPAPFPPLDRTASLALRQPDARLSRVTRIRNAAMLNEPTVAAASQNSKSVRLGTTPASLRVAEGWYVGGPSINFSSVYISPSPPLFLRGSARDNLNCFIFND